MKKIFLAVLFIYFFACHTFAASLPQGMCKPPSTFATGSSVDAIALYYCSNHDVPSEQNIRNIIKVIVNKNNLPFLWFDILLLKPGTVNKNYHEAYNIYSYGYIDAEGNFTQYNTPKHNDQENIRMRTRMLEQYNISKNKWGQEALKKGQLQYETQSPLKSPLKNKESNTQLQNRINTLEKKLRGF